MRDLADARKVRAANVSKSMALIPFLLLRQAYEEKNAEYSTKVHIMKTGTSEEKHSQVSDKLKSIVYGGL